MLSKWLLKARAFNFWYLKHISNVKPVCEYTFIVGMCGMTQLKIYFRNLKLTISHWFYVTRGTGYFSIWIGRELNEVNCMDRCVCKYHPVRIGY